MKVDTATRDNDTPVKLLLGGGESFGEASVYMERFGSYCFGVAGDPYNIESHHMLRLEDYPELVNDPENIQNMLVRVHNLLRMIRIHWGKILHL